MGDGDVEMMEYKVTFCNEFEITHATHQNLSKSDIRGTYDLRGTTSMIIYFACRILEMTEYKVTFCSEFEINHAMHQSLLKSNITEVQHNRTIRFYVRVTTDLIMWIGGRHD